MSESAELAFLKLGGSLITDKTRPSTVLPEMLDQLAGQIAAVLADGKMRWVLGHGSGSFGHVPAQEHGTRKGVFTPEQWLGFAEVWQQAGALNRIVIETLHRHQVPAVAFPPSAGAMGREGSLDTWDISPLQAALAAGLTPVVYGDVAFDRLRGGTIFSTEELFTHLATSLHPRRILIAGIEAGVWADYPHKQGLIERITYNDYAQFERGIAGSGATDVTGGMATKVRDMLDLAAQIPGLEVRIFDGRPAGNLQQAMNGEPLGTLITGQSG